MGPTASGKTAVAAAIVDKLPCEIISVDSAQVYQHMNIGTAKPDAEFLARVPHHLIDLIEPHESYSAARFRDDALTLMREITERGRIPLLVGGTMLYFQALVEGLSDLPEADPAIRLIIDTMAEASGWPALHAELARVDPETAARLKPNDAQRIERALEVYYITNKPLSYFHKKPKYVYFPYSPIKIALLPGEREVLHQRIAQRFEEMLELGLIGELRALRDRVRARAHHAVDALRRLPPGVAVPRRRIRARRAAREGRRRHAPARETPAHVAEIDEGRDRIRLPGRRRGGPGAGFSAAGTGASGPPPRSQYNPLFILYFLSIRPGIICVWRAASVWPPRARAPASPAPGTA